VSRGFVNGLGEKERTKPQPFDLIRKYTAGVVAKIIKYISRQIFPPKHMNIEHDNQSHEPLLTPIQVTFLTQAELAKALGVCRDTVSRWTQAELIPAIRIGSKSVRYDLAEVRHHLISQSKAERIEEEIKIKTTKHN